ncbi:hypothetical protein COU00_03500, partial [Candidatus Falkowbacteria bacterium CG10_big_fil_rev_8_21_14_0_10_43_11]
MPLPKDINLEDITAIRAAVSADAPVKLLIKAVGADGEVTSWNGESQEFFIAKPQIVSLILLVQTMPGIELDSWQVLGKVNGSGYQKLDVLSVNFSAAMVEFFCEAGKTEIKLTCFCINRASQIWKPYYNEESNLTIINAPFPTATPTLTFTPAPTATATFTGTPTITPTATPTAQPKNERPKNVVVQIRDNRYSAAAKLTLYAGQNYPVEITATDDYNDGNKVWIELSDNANVLTKKYCLSDDGKVSWSGQLNIVQPGEYSIAIWASDGNLTSESIILTIEVIIIPTPTPTVAPTWTPTVTPTPTPWPVLVTDNLYSQDDLSGQIDCDDLKGRELCIRWRVFPQTNIRAIHAYVAKNNEAPVYLGQPEKIDDNYLVWQ